MGVVGSRGGDPTRYVSSRREVVGERTPVTPPVWGTGVGTEPCRGSELDKLFIPKTLWVPR